MNRAYSIEDVCEVMRGFATEEEIKEEVNELVNDGYLEEDAVRVVIANIDYWARWNNVKDVHYRIDALGIEVEPEYCTKE